jgi:hypothetical protein
MKNFLKIIFIFLLLFSFGTTTCYAKKAIEKKTALELREIQTHTFETSNEKLVMKAVVNTLQDNGFIIQNIEPDLGYIKAKKEVKFKRTLKGRVVAYSFLETLYTFCVVATLGTDFYSLWGMWQTGMQIKNEVAPHTVIFDSNIDIQKLGKNTN